MFVISPASVDGMSLLLVWILAWLADLSNLLQVTALKAKSSLLSAKEIQFSTTVLGSVTYSQVWRQVLFHFASCD